MQIETLIPDEKLEKDGKWIEWPDNPGVKVLVGYFGSDAYDVKQRKLLIRARKRRGEILPATLIDIDHRAMVGTLLLDWSGLASGFDQDGKEIPFPFNEENALYLLKRSKQFRQFVEAEAVTLENFQAPVIDMEMEVTGGSPKELGDGASAELKSGAGVES